MVSSTENELLTRVDGLAPLGEMLREKFWIPFARTEGLVTGQAPERVRLLGRSYVAFRGEDGRVGFVDELCPHRLASLALARVEGCALRCIYHGWLIDGSGAVVEVPSEGERSASFSAGVDVNRYQTREAGGLVWVFLGQGEAPHLPAIPFLDLPEENRWWSRMVVKCNWFQGFEGALDSVHLNWLHRGWYASEATPDAARPPIPLSVPRYDLEETGYGLRTAAIRKVDEERTHFRVAEFVAPFYALTGGRQKFPTECTTFISVPVDDTTHLLFWGAWDETAPVADLSSIFDDELNRDNLFEGADISLGAGQNRVDMAAGHFSGITRSPLHEDLTVQLSMGPIADRSRETLCSTDLAIARTRRFLVKMIKKHIDGEDVAPVLDAYREALTIPFNHVGEADTDWRALGQSERGKLRNAA